MSRVADVSVADCGNEPDPSRPLAGGLATIPVVDAGSDWALETLAQQEGHCHGFLDAAGRYFPRALLAVGDRMTRRWLARSEHPYAGEIDRIADALGRTGVHTFNLAYEWACLGGVGADHTGTRARFLRVLDYRLRGVGRHLVAVRIPSPVGPWATVTWPGYAGIVQGVAPGRFAACLNQPPSPVTTGVRPIDWFIDHVRIWRQDALPPEYLLRSVFETSSNYAQARERLIHTPIARPTIFIIAGVRPDDGCIIERTETDARVHDGHGSVGNGWVSDAWKGYRRPRRRGPELPSEAYSGGHEPFAWLRPPFCNWKTRLAMVAEPATGLMIVQGYEGRRAATAPLRLDLSPARTLRRPAATETGRPRKAAQITTTLAPTGTR